MVSLVKMNCGWWWWALWECSMKAELDCPKSGNLPNISSLASARTVERCIYIANSVWMTWERNAVAMKKRKNTQFKGHSASRTLSAHFHPLQKGSMSHKEMWDKFSGHLEEFINFKIYISRMEISFKVFLILSHRIRCMHFNRPIWDCEAEHKT